MLSALLLLHLGQAARREIVEFVTWNFPGFCGQDIVCCNGLTDFPSCQLGGRQVSGLDQHGRGGLPFNLPSSQRPSLSIIGDKFCVKPRPARLTSLNVREPQTMQPDNDTPRNPSGALLFLPSACDPCSHPITGAALLCQQTRSAGEPAPTPVTMQSLDFLFSVHDQF
ncbi:hypothetical protein RRG08_041143 [Elysia crispata]|uniref:Uncharacterized protein n=1 Tax=Elysia crispata TaxID=231223 RepID=A0AAE0XXN8_9GAST|nr:hypothetical protein RRG08_041143 [Elysia crispata]